MTDFGPCGPTEEQLEEMGAMKALDLVSFEECPFALGTKEANDWCTGYLSMFTVTHIRRN